VAITVDHVVPVSLGGEDKPENLVAACVDCNAGKSSSATHPGTIAQVDYDQLRWAAAMERAAAIQEARREEREGEIMMFELEWIRWKIDGEVIERPTDWRNSVERLMAAGLDIFDVTDAVKIMMRSPGILPENRFRYFAGVAWRMLRERRELAIDIINAEAPDDPLLGDSEERE
jgi:hypothetical protein